MANHASILFLRMGTREMNRLTLCIMPIMSKVHFGEQMGLKYVIFRTYHLNPKMLL